MGVRPHKVLSIILRIWDIKCREKPLKVSEREVISNLFFGSVLFCFVFNYPAAL